MKTEKPDFDKLVSDDLSVTDNAGYLSAVMWADRVWDQYVIPLQSRVSELERENERLELLIKDNEKWIRIYKSSGEDVAKQMERLEKEVETLRAENLKTCPCKQDGEAIKNSTGE